MNKLLAAGFYSIEVGKAHALVRLIPLLAVLIGIVGLYDIRIYRGFSDAQSMDNAQLARQIERHQGFLTYFIRPYALAQVAKFDSAHGREIFPESVYQTGVPRAIPDTYNSPGFPILLSVFFRLLHVNFDEPTATTSSSHFFAGEHWLPIPNQVCILLTAGLIFWMGLRLFDERVAWMSSVVFIFSDFVWKFSLLATPTNLLMLLMTMLLFGLMELYRMGEAPVEVGPQPSFGWGWAIVPALGLLFGGMCLFCLPLLVLTVPLVIFLLLMPRTTFFVVPLFGGLAAALAAPWFVHWYRICGNPLGSNLVLGLMAHGGYSGDQVFCLTSIPNYDTMLGAAGTKEYHGFLYYFQRGWDVLGSNPMLLFFAVSFLHEFRRKRVQAFRWLIGALFVMTVAMTSLADPNPDPLGGWNLVVVLLPAMIMIGAAFFFVLLDRMITQLRLLTTCIVVGMLALCLMPMFLTYSNSGPSYYNYPPYLPPYLSYLSRFAPVDEWVTSDMPWATAWYGDRVSLWLPETPSDFTSIYDNYCESSFILFTPVTLSKPATVLTSGERKEWMPLLFTGNIPDSFPLKHLIKLPAGGPEYTIIGNQFGNARASH